MRPTAPTQAVFRRTAPGFLSRTRAAGTSSARKANHYFIAYQRLHDHDLTHLSPPGTPDPRQRYWWRRLYTFLIGPHTRFFQKDNIFPEEQAIIFKHPIPGGHGDRFTHDWSPYPGANHKAREALQKWEVENLTPEQLAAKYGVYIPRLQTEDVVCAWLLMTTFWISILLGVYYDDDLGFVTHPVLDDFIRELGGVQPILPEEANLEQWNHPYYHTLFIRKDEPHWSFKPLALDNTKDFSQRTY
ncbi:hypothetical protein DIPPA_05336 [Diplonema papillatum]|nr:hypothetical protein DIPPA_05336 [Diplonema papillatum]